MKDSLTSVCTIKGRCMRRSYTTPYTSTVFSISICWIRRSIAMNVPVLPTPALQWHGEAIYCFLSTTCSPVASWKVSEARKMLSIISVAQVLQASAVRSSGFYHHQEGGRTRFGASQPCTCTRSHIKALEKATFSAKFSRLGETVSSDDILYHVLCYLPGTATFLKRGAKVWIWQGEWIAHVLQQGDLFFFLITLKKNCS